MAGAREDDFATALRAEVVRVLTETSEAPEGQVMDLASRIVRATVERFKGEQVYIRPEGYDEEAIVRDLTRCDARTVCERHDISKVTLWRIRKRRGV